MQENSLWLFPRRGIAVFDGYRYGSRGAHKLRAAADQVEVRAQLTDQDQEVLRELGDQIPAELSERSEALRLALARRGALVFAAVLRCSARRIEAVVGGRPVLPTFAQRTVSADSKAKARSYFLRTLGPDKGAEIVAALEAGGQARHDACKYLFDTHRDALEEPARVHAIRRFGIGGSSLATWRKRKWVWRAPHTPEDEKRKLKRAAAKKLNAPKSDRCAEINDFIAAKSA